MVLKGEAMSKEYSGRRYPTGALIKNWFGYPTHPTDKYITWCKDGEEEKEMAEKLREAYDGIIDKGAKDKLRYLLDSAYERGRFDENIFIQNHKKEMGCPYGHILGEDFGGFIECDSEFNCKESGECYKKHNSLYNKMISNQK